MILLFLYTLRKIGSSKHFQISNPEEAVGSLRDGLSDRLSGLFYICQLDLVGWIHLSDYLYPDDFLWNGYTF